LAMILGAVLALLLWVNVEGSLLVLTAFLTLGLLWVLHGGQPGRDLAVMAQTAALLATLFLFIERPPDEWLRIELDRFSFIYVALAWMAALAALALSKLDRRLFGWPARLGAGVAVLALMPLPVLLLAPELFGGPIGGLDPELKRLWLDGIMEFRPLLPVEAGKLSGGYIFLLGPAWLGLGYALLGLRKEFSPHWNLCLVNAVGGAIFILATMEHVRAFSFAQLMTLPAWTLLAMKGLAIAPQGWRLAPRALGRAAAFSLVLLGPALIAGLLARFQEPKAQTPIIDPCRWDQLGRHIKEAMPASGDRRIIMTYVFSGPELSYFSGYQAVGTPYHRNGAGILDAIHALDDASGQTMRQVAAQRGVSLVAVCRSSPEQVSASRAFAASLLAANTPEWLEALPLPPGLEADMALFRLR
jgi:hypothetical protein